MPANNLSELIAWLKANPDKATAGTAGVGSPQHILRRVLPEGDRHALSVRALSRRRAGDAGSGCRPDRPDRLPTSRPSLPQIRAGNIKAYAVTGKSRLAAAPDIPTVDEAGVPGFYTSIWNALWAPKGTPKNDHRASSMRRSWTLGRSGGARAARRSRPRDRPARPADAGGARGAFTRPRSPNGGRSSRRRASSWNSQAQLVSQTMSVPGGSGHTTAKEVVRL